VGQQRESDRVGELLLQAAARLEDAGVESARVDAELLFAFYLNKSRTELYLAADELLGNEQLRGLFQLVERRAVREPVAYIIGTTEFFSRTFVVSPAVLIPRPETEVLVEAVLERKEQLPAGGAYVDLCCGSGIICITLTCELGQQFRHVVGADISGEALEVCRQNCISHHVDPPIQLVRGDLGSCFAENQYFDLITANPPYVSSADMHAALQPEVVDFEPHLALDGGEDGLELINPIVNCLPHLLAPGGNFFMEIGAEQALSVERIFAQTSDPGMYESVDILQDYSERDRIVHARRKP